MHATTLEILERLSFPLVMPSANLATRPSPSSASHVLATLDGRIDAVLDAGPSELGIESTVIAICDEKPLILRQGHLSKSVLEEALSEHCEESLKLKKDEAPKAPGQSFLHYSPQVKSCHITKISECSSFWQSDSSLIARKSDLDSLTRSLGLRPPSALSISLGDEAPLFARGLYEAFYRCETKPDRDLYIICPPKDEAWLAIYDRIERASAKD